MSAILLQVEKIGARELPRSVYTGMVCLPIFNFDETLFSVGGSIGGLFLLVKGYLDREM